jgi:hypothetical protein
MSSLLFFRKKERKKAAISFYISERKKAAISFYISERKKGGVFQEYNIASIYSNTFRASHTVVQTWAQAQS